MGNTKTRQEGGIASVSDQDLGAMAGEISPDIMFYRCYTLNYMCIWCNLIKKQYPNQVKFQIFNLIISQWGPLDSPKVHVM